MFQIKSLLILASIFCNLCLAAQITNTEGEHRDGEILLYADYKEQSPMQGWSEAVFPNLDNRNIQFVITCIEHKVYYFDNHAYTTKIKSGGIGHKHVELRIEQIDWDHPPDYKKVDYYDDYDTETGWLEIYGVHETCYKK